MGGGGGGRLFEAGRLLTFSAFRMGAYSRWALIRGWALIRINTVAALGRDDERLDPSTRILTVLARLQFLNAASKLSHNKDRDGV